MRAGAEYFTSPAVSAQRRYEALRAYFVDEEPAKTAGTGFCYSKATRYQMAAELRGGRIEFFRSSKPGPKGSRQTATCRDRVLDMRAQDRSVKEIADALTAEGTPITQPRSFAPRPQPKRLPRGCVPETAVAGRPPDTRPHSWVKGRCGTPLRFDP